MERTLNLIPKDLFKPLAEADLLDKQVDTRNQKWNKINHEKQYRHHDNEIIFWIGVVDLEFNDRNPKFGKLSFYTKDIELIPDQYRRIRNAYDLSAELETVQYDFKEIISRLNEHKDMGCKFDHYLIKQKVFDSGEQIVEIVTHPTLDISFPSYDLPLNQKGVAWARKLIDQVLFDEKSCRKNLILRNDAYPFPHITIRNNSAVA